MSWIPDEISMIFSSDPSQGARNTRLGGDYFEIKLEDGLYIPSDAKNVNLSVQEASVWWTVPNILTGVNDKLYITQGAQPYILTIPQGLYSLSKLELQINTQLLNVGASPDLIDLRANTSTNRSQIIFNQSNVSIDFTQPNTFREVLGFNSGVFGLYATIPFTVESQNVANFNSVNYFLLHSNIVDKGIRFNNQFTQVISQVYIDVEPGSQIIHKPFNPATINADNLAASPRSSLKFWITDDKNRSINTNNEYWSLRVLIHYLRYIKNQ